MGQKNARAGHCITTARGTEWDIEIATGRIHVIELRHGVSAASILTSRSWQPQQPQATHAWTRIGRWLLAVPDR
jgi:hypothetical protein